MPKSGACAAKRLRRRANTPNTALVNSLRMWNWQIWWGIDPNTRSIGSGYSGEPSVVMPRTVLPRVVIASLTRARNQRMSACVGS